MIEDTICQKNVAESHKKQKTSFYLININKLYYLHMFETGNVTFDRFATHGKMNYFNRKTEKNEQTSSSSSNTSSIYLIFEIIVFFCFELNCPSSVFSLFLTNNSNNCKSNSRKERF